MIHLTGKEAARILGVHPETLRRWDNEEKLPFQAHKTKGGHRKYPQKEVEILADYLKRSQGTLPIVPKPRLVKDRSLWQKTAVSGQLFYQSTDNESFDIEKSPLYKKMLKMQSDELTKRKSQNILQRILYNKPFDPERLAIITPVISPEDASFITKWEDSASGATGWKMHFVILSGYKKGYVATGGVLATGINIHLEKLIKLLFEGELKKKELQEQEIISAFQTHSFIAQIQQRRGPHKLGQTPLLEYDAQKLLACDERLPIPSKAQYFRYAKVEFPEKKFKLAG